MSAVSETARSTATRRSAQINSAIALLVASAVIASTAVATAAPAADPDAGWRAAHGPSVLQQAPPQHGAAQPPAPQPPAAQPEPGPSPSPAEESLARLIRQEILDGLKGEYVDEDDWGRTTEATLYKVEGKGLNLKLSKRKKAVRDGLWKKYRVELIDPAQHLKVRVVNFRALGSGRFDGQLFLSAQLRGEGRVERWRRGVKMLNFKAEGTSTVEVRLDWQVALKLVPTGYFPDVVVEPEVTAVGLRLADFKLERLSKIDGWAAHELGDSLKGTIGRELSRREGKVAQKINVAMKKKEHRFSPAGFVKGRWGKLAASGTPGTSVDTGAPANAAASSALPAGAIAAPSGAVSAAWRR